MSSAVADYFRTEADAVTGTPDKASRTVFVPNRIKMWMKLLKTTQTIMDGRTYDCLEGLWDLGPGWLLSEGQSGQGEKKKATHGGYSSCSSTSEA